MHAAPAATGTGAGDGEAGMPDGDIQWAMEIDPADVMACGGYVPERCLDGLTGDGEPSAGKGEVAGNGPLDEQIPAACVDVLTGKADPGGDVVTEEEDTFHHETVAPDEDLGLDNNVTNEPNPDEKDAGSQLLAETRVAADSGKGSALDKPENEPNREGGSTAVGVADSQEDEASMGDRLPTQHHARAPALPTAVSRREKKKSKRDGRVERKALARRELERRLRAHLAGDGGVAEANKLIDDLRAAFRQEFRDLLPRGPRGP
jgi:hypothetical protein